MATKRKKEIYTNTGHPLSINEDRFIDKYLELGNGSQAVVQAGYTTKAPQAYSNLLLRKIYISEEIKFRRDQMHEANIASGKEVMDFLTKVMRGEVNDQFGLEAPVSERIKAADLLAKRTVDIDNRLAGKKDMSTPELKIVVDWNRDKKEDNDGTEET